MFFDVVPSMSGGKLSATMNRDGYLNVPDNNVLFPSIGASPQGPVVMSFTLSGVDHYPSAAWARLDGLGEGHGPTVHVAAEGAQPEDGFTGRCLDLGQGGFTNVGGLCSSETARWGDYSASAVDEHGCIWSDTEYISGLKRLPGVGDWATYVTRIQPAGCNEPPLTPPPVHVFKPCLPLIVGQDGSDNFGGLGLFIGQNPQMNILKGDLKMSADGNDLITTLTIKNLNKKIAQPGGAGNIYYFYWSFHAINYYSWVEVDPAGNVTYGDGTLKNSHSDNPGHDTGSFNEGPNGTVVVNVPVSRVGGPSRGDILTQISAETREFIGVKAGLPINGLVEPVDSASSDFDFLVGQKCLPVLHKPVKVPVKVKGEHFSRNLAATGVDDQTAYVLGIALVAAAAGSLRRLRRRVKAAR